MKALVYEKAHSLEDFASKLAEVSEPIFREFDVLVGVHAVGINPGRCAPGQLNSRITSKP